MLHVTTYIVLDYKEKYICSKVVVSVQYFSINEPDSLNRTVDNKDHEIKEL